MILTSSEDFDVIVANLGSDSTKSAGPLQGALALLLQSDLTWGRNLTLGSVTPALATFTGYGNDTVTWRAASRADDGAIEAVSLVQSWLCSGTATTNSIYGLAIISSDSTKLYFNGRFDSGPLPMGATLDRIDVLIRWRSNTGGLVAVIS